MRRRLWWSLVLFDARISEMAGNHTATLAPTWDCRIPLNVNDSDLRLEMKKPPEVQVGSSEALFAVVRSALGEFVRHTKFHLDFTNPALKPFAKIAQYGSVREEGELATLEDTIEAKYLKFCDQENALHFMTIWSTKAYIARCRLMEYHSRISTSSLQQTEEQSYAPVLYSLDMLKCDTMIATSSLTKGFRWLTHSYFPLLAYHQIVQGLKRRPSTELAEHAWEVMCDNYEAQCIQDSPFFELVAKVIMQAWKAHEAALQELGKPLVPSRIVTSIRQKLARKEGNTQKANMGQPSDYMDMRIDNFWTSTQMDFESNSLLYTLENQDSYETIDYLSL
jgi:hypothetical protein